MCRLSWNLGALTFWNPQGLSRPVMGLLYLLPSQQIHINKIIIFYRVLDWVWNVMAHAQKPDFVFRRNGRVHINRQGRQFFRLMAAEVCASAVVMLDTPCYEVVWRVLATHSIRQFPLHFPSRASPCAITFQLDSTIHRHVSVASATISSVSYRNTNNIKINAQTV